MTLQGIFPTSEQSAQLQANGWSLVSTTGVMAAIKKDESGLMLPWPEALAKVQAEQAAAAKAAAAKARR